MEEREDPGPLAQLEPRRRRRPAGAEAQALVEAPAAPLAAEANGGPPQERPRRQWWPQLLSSWGLSPTFRIYLFLGSILALIAFLVYSESLIREVKEQERSRVDSYAHLHAFAVSSLAAQEPAAFIFQEVINKGNFPIIFTNHRGEVTDWRGANLPSPGDTAAAARQLLAEVMREMDTRNPPIAFVYYPEAVGYFYCDGYNFIITDNAEQVERRVPVEWVGKDLPSPGDTSAAALEQVRQLARRLEGEGKARTFKVPAESFNYLYYGTPGFVIADSVQVPRAWAGADLPSPGDTSAAALEQVQGVRRQLAAFNEARPFRIPSEMYIHYGDSELVQRISQGPFFLIGAVLLFSLVGYIGFRNIRRSEQRSIWVGMAKETAHQLGTPLSSLSGWLELMTSEIESAEAAGDQVRADRLYQMLREMQKDMGRLNQIASRFSQIGSIPELRAGDVKGVLLETINYFKSRGPQFGRHDIQMEFGELAPIPLNPELLNWAFENLFKNAVDAIGRKAGTIRIRAGLRPERDAVQITFQDDGKGIAPENIDRVFQPGFSTKKRGWGLGLTFVRRIVEEYHKGKISIVHSVPGEGTTFEILLPVK